MLFPQPPQNLSCSSFKCLQDWHLILMIWVDLKGYFEWLLGRPMVEVDPVSLEMVFPYMLRTPPIIIRIIPIVDLSASPLTLCSKLSKLPKLMADVMKVEVKRQKPNIIKTIPINRKGFSFSMKFLILVMVYFVSSRQ